jgi:hypothetical protein
MGRLIRGRGARRPAGVHRRDWDPGRAVRAPSQASRRSGGGGQSGRRPRGVGAMECGQLFSGTSCSRPRFGRCSSGVGQRTAKTPEPVPRADVRRPRRWLVSIDAAPIHLNNGKATGVQGSRQTSETPAPAASMYAGTGLRGMARRDLLERSRKSGTVAPQANAGLTRSESTRRIAGRGPPGAAGWLAGKGREVLRPPFRRSTPVGCGSR